MSNSLARKDLSDFEIWPDRPQFGQKCPNLKLLKNSNAAISSALLGENVLKLRTEMSDLSEPARANADKNVRFVAQEDENGCSLACIAMITGLTYAEVKAAFPTFCNCCGTHEDPVIEFLADSGYALAFKHEWLTVQRRNREEWPVRPFADVHLVKVKVKEECPLNHHVIMLGDGTVLDPETDGSPRRLSDYLKIFSIAGVSTLTLSHPWYR